MPSLDAIKQLLWRHYTAPQQVIFKQFRAGAIYFAVGLMAVLMANNLMEPSLAQEWVVLAGLVVGGIGFVVAMLAQMRLLIARLVTFFRGK